MEPLFKKGFYAGLGLLILTKEKAEEIVNDLVKRGEVSKGESAQLMKDMMAKVDDRTKEGKEWVEKQVNDAVEKLRPKVLKQMDALTEEVEKLGLEIKKLQKEIAKLKKQ
ncbi:MAG: hypothetical protein GXO75_16835 [Calditrichaeota bacterium]|nr:hypothetical protein [Calditrichota bacterium]